ncbi:Hsp20/alpha crystallin family protein [Litoribacter alkaliphilus]|uniref:Hsp20/alpha crystallin family protein n=2 Tax=Litoribacter ruber TaxID=702568 RepID=A0AAP2G0K9_9BACT|nr:Hsp20/alpha crystallin family protein [Litoribacter alkaliphilus]
MTLMKYNQLEQNYPSTFSGLLDKFFNENVGTTLKQFSPAVDVSEEADKYQIQVAVPGLKKNDFHIDLIDGKLTISGERKMEDKKEGKNFHTIETQYGSFSRSFFLPDDVAQEKVSAVYEDGLLKLSLPKLEHATKKYKIEVK